jgi:hypothetical protein
MKELEVEKTGNGTFVYETGRGRVCRLVSEYQQEKDEDASQIVRACNAFPVLFAALERLMNGSWESKITKLEMEHAVRKVARAALAQVTKTQGEIE